MHIHVGIYIHVQCICLHIMYNYTKICPLQYTSELKILKDGNRDGNKVWRQDSINFVDAAVDLK